MDAPNHAMTGALLRARLVTLESMNRRWIASRRIRDSVLNSSRAFCRLVQKPDELGQEQVS